LADFTRFEPLIVQIRSWFLGQPTKKGHYKKTHDTYFLGIPHQTKFNQNWRISRGCRHNQSHQVW